MKRIALFLLLCSALWMAEVFNEWLNPTPWANSLLFTNGPSLTMYTENDLGDVLNTPPTIAEALLVENGRIAAVGKLADMQHKITETTEVINLKGNTLMPRFIEPHSHPILTAMLGNAIDVSGFTHGSREEIMATLKEKVSTNPINGWNVAVGWDPIMIADLSAPTLAELDAISPDTPLVILTQMLHDAYVNSAALTAAGITADTPAPEGGAFIKNQQGELTGTIHEVSAVQYLMKNLPKPPTGAVDLLVNMEYSRFAQAGYTTVGVLGPVGRVDDPLAILEKLSQDPQVPIRTIVYGLPEQLTNIPKPPTATEFYHLRGVKFWMDGSPFTGGAAWAEPYENTWLTQERLHLKENHMGAMNFSESDFAEQFRDFHRRGFQIAIHVQGEQAIDRVLTVAEAVLAEYPRSDHRYRLEHNALITEEQIKKAHELGFTLSFFIDHIYFYGEQLPLLIGEERSQRYMPMSTAKQISGKTSFHGDHPATPINPLRSLTTSLTRKTQAGNKTLGEQQALTRWQALEAMTTDAAWQLGIDHEIGSLAPGKKADLVILSENPLECSLQELRSIQVKDTWINGQRVNNKLLTPSNLNYAWQVVKNFF